MSSWRIAALCAAGAVAVSILSCGRATRNEPIRLGAIFAITGPSSFLGGPEARTAQMLVEEINAGGGIKGRPVELLIKDSQGDPEKALAYCKQLIEEDQVLAIIGPSTTGETMKIKSICEESQTILISCAAAEEIVKPAATWVFKTPQNDSQAATRIFDTMKKMGIASIGLLTDNTPFGMAGKQLVESMAPAERIEIVISEVYDQTATDLTDVLKRLKGKKVQAIITWSAVPAQALVAKNMKEIGLNVPLFHSHGFGNLKYIRLTGEAGEGIMFPGSRLLVADLLPEGHPQKALLLKYKSDYETKFGEDVSMFGGHAYDALLILRKALENAPSMDREAVRATLENLKGVVGTAGQFNFSRQDHNGLDTTGLEMLTVKGGKLAFLQ